MSIPHHTPAGNAAPTPTNGKEQSSSAPFGRFSFLRFHHQAGKAHERKKNILSAHIDRVSLSGKLVVCTIAVLLVGISVISFSLRTLVGNYMMDKTDSQLVQQSEWVFKNTDTLLEQQRESSGNTSSAINSYFVQLQYTDGTKNEDGEPLTVNLLMPQLKDGIVSVPVLPTNGDTMGVTMGTPFTVQAVARQIVTVSSGSRNDSNGQGGSDDSQGTGSSNESSVTVMLSAPDAQADHATINVASAPWRVRPVMWTEPDGKGGRTTRGVIYIGLSLYDQIDTINTLTRYCIIVGFAVVLLAGSLATLVIQHTLTPLKRMEKTAAKIAAGDLSQRVPPAPENTEIGSLSASLNIMLSRIETSFHEQEETTAKMKRFVSDASHELRTPLAAIHGYAELYKMQRDMPGALERADESIDHIERSSQRMTVLVEDLLSLARLDEGRGIDVNGTVGLTMLVTDAIDDLHALDPERVITRKQVHLQAATDLNHPAALALDDGQWASITLPGDASRLRQVVTNIVGNIHRYTPADSPCEVAVGVLTAAIDPALLARLPADDASMRRFIEAAEVGASMNTGYRYAVLQFMDHGPGVPDDKRSEIFERFYTADPSRARDKGGTGLGLAIALSVVRAHHGFICATETPGGGLTFTVVLPIGHVDAPAPAAQNAQPVKQGKTKPAWFSGEHR